MQLSSITLKFYRRLARWLPFYSLGDKLAGVAFCAINLPLLSLLAYAAAHGHEADPRSALWLAVLATLGGTGLSLWVLHQLLAPLRHAERALQMYRAESRVMPLPTDLRDDMGQFLRDLRRMLETAEERRSQLDLLSFDDPLTGLPNRRNAENYLELAMAATERAGGRLTVALFDLEDYHAVVDRLGTEGANHALQATGEFMKLWLRRKTDWVARWGGCRFIAILFADPHSAAEYVDTVGRQFAREFADFDGRALTLVSGVSEVHRHEDVKDCVRRAAAALQQGRGDALDLADMPAAARRLPLRPA